MEDTIKFGPRPEKLWVGMRGVTRVGNDVTLKSISESSAIYYRLMWSNEWCTDTRGNHSVGKESSNDIVSWEQPIPELSAEPDWKAKYEQLMEKHEMLEEKMEVLVRNYYDVSKKKDAATGVALYLRKDRDAFRDKAGKYDEVLGKLDTVEKMYEKLQAELKAQECAYNVVVARRDYMEKRYEVLRRTFNETQAELNDVYKAQSKLNKIVRIVNDLECEDDD